MKVIYSSFYSKSNFGKNHNIKYSIAIWTLDVFTMSFEFVIIEWNGNWFYTLIFVFVMYTHGEIFRFFKNYFLFDVIFLHFFFKNSQKNQFSTKKSKNLMKFKKYILRIIFFIHIYLKNGNKLSDRHWSLKSVVMGCYLGVNPKFFYIYLSKIKSNFL